MGRAYLSSFLFAHAVDGLKDPYAGTKVLYRRTSCPECLSFDALPLHVDQTYSFEDDVFAFGDTVMEVGHPLGAHAILSLMVLIAKRLWNLEDHTRNI
jgi:hypothetical protein